MQQYLPVTQKYRPQRFSELIGQSHIAVSLKSAFEQNSIAPAYLFTGPHGVGKTSAARIFARLINCTSPDGNEPCGVCENCREIMEGSSLDVIEIDAASNRRIDEVRQLRENVKFAPVKCKYKVYIIDEVHMLTLEAFNALLKTLEEPPSYVRFILATTHPHKLPSTVLSRCCRMDFNKPSVADIREYVGYVCKKEGIDIGEDLLELVVKRAQGSMRDAASFLEQVIVVVKSGEFSSSEIVKLLGGQTGTEGVLDVVKAILSEDISAIVKLVDNIIRMGEDVGYIVEEIERILRASLLFAKGVDREFWQVEESYFGWVERFSSKMGEFGIFYCLQIIIKMKEWLRTGILDRLALELGFIKMASALRFKPLWEMASYQQGVKERSFAVSSKKLRDNGVSIKKGLADDFASDNSEIGKKKGSIAQSDANIEMGGSGIKSVSGVVPDFWKKAQEILFSERKMLLGHLLQDAKYVNLKGDVLEIVFSHRLSYDSMKDPKNVKILIDVINRVVGKTVKFRFGVLEKKDKTERKNVLDGKIKDVLDVFDGKVIEKGKKRG